MSFSLTIPFIMSDDITPVNYCTHAIEDLKETAKNARIGGLTVTASRLETVIQMLSAAPKFLLPNCAELIDTENVRETHLELLRLPYPVTVFEAPWRKDDVIPAATVAGVQESLSTRRIALCWEMTEDHVPVRGLREIPLFREHYPEGGVFIYPIYYSDELKSWNPGAGGTFVPREFRIPEGHAPTRMTQMMRDVKESTGRLHRNAVEHFAEPFVLLHEMFDVIVAESHGDVDAAFARLTYDANDEVHMAIQACAVLNCANIGTVDVHPKPAMNARRLATRRPPFFTYKVLQLTAGKPTSGGKGSGSHAAPRTHLRRGHIRRLEDRVTWVRPAVVNAGSERGVVAKDYRIGGRDSGDAE
ncbi:hypothetical protein C6Q14_27200 [Burkholderia ambifaria]|uniref:hypothetical protein n=1 Tax=Burkholderia ambifaria TaxID=152480 RepID=UPI000CFEFC92|nr:hypothetical protein [Burkholderia ambifaria]MBR8186560.1 hypothetical protein [Burkholderia ambifaria]PRF98027.1 hypothetical protein C6Q14_27200 [Burkholderia ambifaria]